MLALDSGGHIANAMRQAHSWSIGDWEVNGAMVTARVRVTSKKSLYLQFSFKPWSEEEKERLLDKIAGNRLVAAKVLGGELDPLVLKMAEKEGVALFPQSWKELKMYCSCPAWAMPCHHVAFVLYSLCFKIDHDPFLLFRIRGVELQEEMKKRTTMTVSDEVRDVAALSSLIRLSDVAERPREEPADAESVTEEATIHNVGKIYCDALPECPPFYTTDDFKQIYSGELQWTGRRAASIMEGRSSLEKELNQREPKPLEAERLHQYAVSQDIDHDSKWSIRTLMALMDIDDEEAKRHSASSQALRHAIKLALRLMAAGAVKPVLGKTQSGQYGIRWMPAMGDPCTCQAVERLERMLPADLLTFSRKHLAIENQAEILLTLIISQFIVVLSHPTPDNTIYTLFFKHGEADLPLSEVTQISGWLSHLDMGSHKYPPVVMVAAEDMRFKITLGTVIESEPVTLDIILSDSRYEPIRYEVLREVTLLSAYLEQLNNYVESGGMEAMEYDSEQFADFLMEVMPIMQGLNVKIILPAELKKLIRPQVRLSIAADESSAKLKLADMLRFQWEVTMDGETVDVNDFAEICKESQRLFRYKGRYIYMGEEELKQLREALKGERRVSGNEMLQAALGESHHGREVHLTDEVREMIRQFSAQPDLSVPRGLKGKLRPYQKRGYEWMYRNAQLGFGSIIADDMGLGKTIQVIALLLKFKQEAKRQKERADFLIVVPTTLISNWKNELERFAPSLSCTIYHGSDRDIERHDNDVLLTTYGMVRSDIEKLCTHEWHTVVIDEAQNIKNYTAEQSRALKKIKATHHIAMSGTPVENRLTEFWSIMDFVNKGYLGTVEKFRNDYATPIQMGNSPECAERFRRVTAPFLLRRLKSDRSIINDLPDKIEENTIVSLSKTQAALYHSTVEEAMLTIEKSDTSTPQGLFKRQGLVLQMMTSLKQICDHPALFSKTSEEAVDYANATATQSGKVETLLTLVESIIDSNQKVLIFTQYREMGELLMQFIYEHTGEKALFLHGGTTVKQRKEMVDEFQNNTERRIFLLSIKAGGTGLNLTAASHVIHYDLWWNPAVETQATDRAYRIGQHQNVIVHRFITKGTFEEQIDKMIQSKRHLADITVAAGESWIGKLSDEELKELFK